jgi:hypothetical protein
MATKVIMDKKEAGKFAQRVIEQNINNFNKCDSATAAYKYFQSNYPQVNLTYDNFWYHLKVVKKRLGVIEAPKESKVIPTSGDIMTDFVLTSPAVVADVEIIIYDPHKDTVKDEIFIPYTTGKLKDQVVSKKIGFMPGTTTVYTGGPSVGKTTVALDDLHNAKIQFLASLKKAADKKLADEEFMYFSSEMKRIDLQSEQKDKEWMKDIKAVLMNEYPENQYKALVEKVILYGYRMLVIDSFQDILECLVTFAHMTAGTATSFLLNLISKANAGETTTGHNTCILLIQQVTKGGVFVGKNSLKHNTTAMLEFKFDDNKSDRYCEFTKNRRNGPMLYKKLYYSLNEANEVVYDEAKWIEDREREAIIKREKVSMDESREEFESIFNKIQEPGADDEDGE